jgi:diaminopimelate decarboxylase
LNDLLRTVARDFGTPAYVYFMDQVRAQATRLRSVFGNRFRLRYAVKSNPNTAVLQRMQAVVDSLDVSSDGEVLHAVAAGWNPARMGFTGPGKTDVELETALRLGVGELVVESVDEAEMADAVARGLGRLQPVLVRIAPARVPRGFGLNMSGKPSQFGIDEEDIDPALRCIQALKHLTLIGFHIYSGTQCLDAAAIAENYEMLIDIFRRVCGTYGVCPRTLIFGAGLGIPYHEGEVPVDLESVAARTIPALDALRREPGFGEAQFVLETGRFLIGVAGIYLTRVVRRKRSRGIEICICDGGMNHHLAAAGHLGTVIQRNYRMFKVTAEPETAAEAAYNIVGPLCTTIDTLGRQVRLRGVEAGNLIAIESSGAYGATASPIHFIGHAPPREIIVDTVDGRVQFEDGSELGGDWRSPIGGGATA